jgi:hypothetical protein
MKLVARRAGRASCSRLRFGFAAIAAAMSVAHAGIAEAGEPQTVTIPASKDNTLIESATGAHLSNGAGDSIFVGRVGNFGQGTRRRGVIAFDVADAVPPGSTITEVSLQLYMAQTVSGAQTVGMRRLAADWGEGTSVSPGGQGAAATPGDATWVNRFHPDVPWASPGGEFSGIASATASVAGPGHYVWSGEQLVADVQSFLDDPGGNFGWVLIGNEAVLFTAKRFASREETEASFRPALTITYIAGQSTPGDLDGNGVVDVFDLLILLGEWGQCADPSDCPADLDNSGAVDVFDLLILLGNWG